MIPGRDDIKEGWCYACQTCSDRDNAHICSFPACLYGGIFIPLSVKADIDMICRNALLNMENAGGLSSDKNRN